MSLGIFRSIRGSYVERSRHLADLIIRRLNEHLAGIGLPPYTDPDPNERGLRVLPCGGGASASTFQRLETLAASAGLAWTLGSLKGHRQIALPSHLEGVISVNTGHFWFRTPKLQEFCSVEQVSREAVALAPALHVELSHGRLSDDLIRKIANEVPFFAGDEEQVLRGLWLDLCLAAQYCLEDARPLVVA